MKGYRIKKIEKMQDLVDAEYDWVLKHCGVSFEDVKNCYVIVGQEGHFEKQQEQHGIVLQVTNPITVTIITNVDKYLYHEQAKAWLGQDGNLWITEEEMERVTT